MLKILTLVLSAKNHPDLLAGTVLLVHRPGHPVDRLTMQRPADDSNLCHNVEFLADPEQADHHTVKPAELIQVVCAETRKQDPKRARTTPFALAET